MVDGIAIIEVHNKDKFRLHELKWLDFRLEDVLFEDMEGTEQLVEQLPQDFEDALLLVTFNYTCKSWRSYEGEWDAEEYVTVVSHQVLKEGYKEFNRILNTELYDLYSKSYSDNFILNEGYESNEMYISDLLSEWEEFYEEDFVRAKPKETDMEKLFRSL